MGSRAAARVQHTDFQNPVNGCPPGCENTHEARKAPEDQTCDNPTEETPSPEATSHNTNPLHNLRKEIRETKHYDARSRQHVLNAIAEILSICGKDARQQSCARDSCQDYGEQVKITAALRGMPVTDPSYEKLVRLRAALGASKRNAFKAARLRADGKRAGGKDQSSVFSPPRVQSDTEKAAEQVA